MPTQPEYSPAGVRFGEAIDNLKGKLPEASLRWDDLAGSVHGKVFTVAGDVMAYAGPMPCGCDVPRVTVVGASSRSVWFEWGDETQEIRDRRSFAWSFKKVR